MSATELLARIQATVGNTMCQTFASDAGDIGVQGRITKADFDTLVLLASGGTPAARWRVEGKADPHGDRYDCERAATAGGHMSDDEVANAVFLDPNIGNLTIAKDRIRWLSRRLASNAQREALLEVEDSLGPVERTPNPDPACHDEVAALGRRIGFGALMTTAERAWRDSLADEGFPVGGEFVSGPTRVAIDSCLKKVRAALDGVHR